MASCVVAVAGGTGKLGRTIVDELVAHGGYKVFILGREVSLLFRPTSRMYPTYRL